MTQNSPMILLSQGGQINEERSDPGSLESCIIQHCTLGMATVILASLMLALTSAVSVVHCLGLGIAPSSSQLQQHRPLWHQGPTTDLIHCSGSEGTGSIA